MTPEEIRTLIHNQAQAYQTATTRYGRGKSETRLIQPPATPDPLALSGRRGSHSEARTGTHGQPTGGYGKPDIMSYYAPVKKMAGAQKVLRTGGKSIPAGNAWDNAVRIHEDTRHV